LAGNNHRSATGRRVAPPELFAIRDAIRKGKPLPEGVTCDRGVYEPRESIWMRFKQWVRPKKGCGCKKRKQRLNGWIPGLGDLVELFTTYTGLKRLWYWWHGQSA